MQNPPQGEDRAPPREVQAAPEPRRFWDLEGLSREVGLKPDTLRRLCVRGRIPGARRVGGVWAIHRETFERFFRDAVPRWKEPKPVRTSLKEILG